MVSEKENTATQTSHLIEAFRAVANNTESGPAEKLRCVQRTLACAMRMLENRTLSPADRDFFTEKESVTCLQKAFPDPNVYGEAWQSLEGLRGAIQQHDEIEKLRGNDLVVEG